MKPTLHIYRSLPPAEHRQPCALTIGSFDGVHLGHQAILARVCEAAANRGLLPSAMTFSPHPREYFARLRGLPDLVPRRISSLRDQCMALAQAGMRQLVVRRFDHTLANMSPDDFVRHILVEGLDVRWLLVGSDFRYGRARSGDIATLRQAGAEHGFEVHTLDDVLDARGRRISSSDIREALASADMVLARDLLGRWPSICAHVRHGRKLGRNLGFPTMNQGVPERSALRPGIYVTRVHGLADRPLAGVSSLGVRPTVEGEGKLLLETHLLDTSADAYGKLINVEFLHYLRDEKKFSDLDALTAAIRQDADDARAYFSVHGL
ncbi:FMN adenylyltransferase /riboflavin kinase [Kerstersia gyiorum]|uniref:Riboflavin biosynthesis protein n=1 Tax=Kerstersia gyiorum TaxID=206506 RepID=A0A4Q7MQ07_9BURK|nr:bifunctional riboflavin kinase/FAD synthetase [Kerstersia gyiorum]KAB0543339.1 bifunctional riboflavin kinase/FAD synthetase [Kerstersia gyiorum]RZS70340.1 FMN adenylyltransferase /riboflavin kinase [Kerstersia gyiorum]